MLTLAASAADDPRDMGKAIAIGLVVAAAAGFWLLRGRDGEAKAVRACIEKTGASVEDAPNAKRTFPYALALGSGQSVQEMPELNRASVYGVRQGAGEALLFFARNGDDAASLEQTFVGFGAAGGIRVPAKRAGKVLLVWTVPVDTALSWPVDSCLE